MKTLVDIIFYYSIHQLLPSATLSLLYTTTSRHMFMYMHVYICVYIYVYCTLIVTRDDRLWPSSFTYKLKVYKAGERNNDGMQQRTILRSLRRVSAAAVAAVVWWWWWCLLGVAPSFPLQTTLSRYFSSLFISICVYIYLLRALFTGHWS